MERAVHLLVSSSIHAGMLILSACVTYVTTVPWSPCTSR